MSSRKFIAYSLVIFLSFLYSGLVLASQVFRDAANSNPLFTISGEVSFNLGLADVNGNGALDILVVNDGANKLFTNDGFGTYIDHVTGLPAADTDNSRSAAFIDFDGDSDLDLFVMNAGVQSKIYLNDGAGGFADDTAARLPTIVEPSLGMAVGDVNGDGNADIVVANFRAQNKIYINNGTGGFTDETATRLPADTDGDCNSSLGDVDGDGDLDILIGDCEVSGGQNTLLINDGIGVFADETATRLPVTLDRSFDVIFADVDGDTDLDILVSNGSGSGISNQNRLLINDGTGVYVDETVVRMPAVENTSRHIHAGDIDGDGDLDVLVSIDGAINQLLLNDSAGNFTDVTATQMPADADATREAQFGDVEGDGDLDIIVANISGQQNRIYINNGAGLFTAQTEATSTLADVDNSRDAVFFDFDGDSDLDLFVMNASVQSKLYLNDGTGGFIDDTVARLPTMVDPSLGMAAGDVNGDGNVDIVVANFRAQNKIYINNGAGGFTDETATRLPVDTDGDCNSSLGDVDGDGDLDILISDCETAGGQNRLLINDGAGVFADETAVRLPVIVDRSFDAIFADVDGDTDLDILVSNGGGSGVSDQNLVLINDGLGVFVDETAIRLPVSEAKGRHIHVGDVDGDGDLDILVSIDGDANQLLLNDGAGVFTDVTATQMPADVDSTREAQFADIEGDGDLDIVVANIGGQQNRIYINNGAGSFVDETDTIFPVDSDTTFNLALGDVDGDDDIDLFFLNNGQNRLYINVCVTCFVPGPVTTASPLGGAFNVAQSVTLTADDSLATIYYTIDGSEPTTSSAIYGSPISISVTTTLKFFAVNLDAIAELINTEIYLIDTVVPVSTATPVGGLYNSVQSVVLTANESASIYYTIDGSAPTTASFNYSSTGPISIGVDTVLKFFAVDDAGNAETVNTESYTIDLLPVTTATPAGGLYGVAQTVTLAVSETATTYYTTDGSVPTTSSSVYSGALNIATDTVLQFFSVDLTGNVESVNTETYAIDFVAPVTTATPASGTYVMPAAITLSSNESSTIYYTIDGSIPTTASMVYTDPLTVSDDTTVQFFAIDTIGNVEAVKSESYVKDLPPITTASPAGGIYTSVQSITLSSNESATIYYTLDGSLPTTGSAVYSGPISISADATLQFFGVDSAGLSEAVKSEVYVVDTIAPVTTASPLGGSYNSIQSVVLSSDEPATIYYTVDGSTPTTASTVYVSSLTVSVDTTLQYFAVDTLGNVEAVKSETYIIDPPPTTTATPAGGTYGGAQLVTLTADETATIYYTVDGSIPTTASTVYSGPINIADDTTLLFFGVDGFGNTEVGKSEVYVIDNAAPITTSSLPSGTYSDVQSVVLTSDEVATIYYTVDGSVPTTISSVYSSPIPVVDDLTLLYFAVDVFGNTETINSESYVISAPLAFSDLTGTQLPVDADNSRDAAFIDFDGDSDLDLFVMNAGVQSKIYLNNGAGGFVDDTAARLPTMVDPSIGMAVGDVNGDGNADIVVANFRAQNKIYINNGAGGFTDETVTRLPADTDGDCNSSLGDVDGDGDLDILISDCESAGGQNTLLINDGTGVFTDETATRLPVIIDRSFDAIFADVDSDSDLDILVSNGSGSGGVSSQNLLLINDGTGVFVDETVTRMPAVENASRHIHVGDVDGDGDLDILVSIDGDANQLLLNDGAGVFTDVTATQMPADTDATREAQFGDVNNDGDLDIFVANLGGQQNRIYLNDGFGTFTDQTSILLPVNSADSFYVSAADVDADGDIDLYVANNGQNRLYINGCGTCAPVNTVPTGSVTIGGVVAEDSTLIADASTLADVDGLGAFAYQWNRSGVAILGATSSTYLLGDVDVGTAMTVTVSYTDGGGTDESVTSAATTLVANINDVPTGSVSISGVVAEDSTLTASNTLADGDGLGTVSYQWSRDGVAISGATSSTYVLGDADAGAAITVTASYTDGNGTTESVTSSATVPVVNVNDAPTGDVTISGIVAEDSTLTASNTLADGDGLGTVTYQWSRDGVAISGATSNTYLLGDADAGTAITVTASYTDGNGTAESVTSSATVPVVNVNDAPTGDVTISGTVAEDSTLTASNTLADGDGLGTVSYQWSRDGVAISGATSSTYTLGDTDAGTAITVTASYTDGNGTAESVTSTATAPVTNVNDAPTGDVTISGIVAEDSTLTASNTLADGDGLGTVSYQWSRDGVAITGATASTYTLGDADAGTAITVTASYTDGNGSAESVTSTATVPVVNVNDAPTGDVTITGIVAEDSTLTASNTLADGDGLGTISYQWSRDGVAIAGATSSTYTLGDADAGTAITVTASYTDGNGTTESVTSAATAPVTNVNDAPTGDVTITGIVAEDSTLTASNTLADGDGLGTVTYQWSRDGSPIAGATSSTYTLGDADAGTAITVTASYTDGNGTAESITSSATAPVTNVNDAPTGDVTITGVVAEDSTLTAANTLADGDGLGTISYQWSRDGVAITGATSSTYTLGDADAGTAITVTASYTDGNGTAESVSSAATVPVVNVNDVPTGNVTISGVVAEDSILTANNTLADGDGLGTVSYQWSRDGVAITGATSSTYVLGDADAGTAITVTASYTDGNGTAESLTSSATVPVVNVNDAPTGNVTISGIVAEDSTLTATNTLADGDGLGTVSYQWSRDGVAISGATSSTYLLGDADAGAAITVTASYTDGNGSAESVSSSATVPVVNVNDAPTGDVSITGVVAEDSTLTASNTLADADGLGTVTYQWSRDGVAISGATASTYTLGDADAGTAITVTASYTDGNGTAESVTSTATAPVTNVNDAPTGDVSITGVVAEDSTLTASNTLADGDGLGTVSYQWSRDGSPIAGATSSTYLLGDADVGAAMTVTASYTDGYGAAESVTSSATVPVANVNDAPFADSQVVSVVEDNALAITLTGSDIDGDLLSFGIVGSPANGVLTGSGAALTYTPDQDFNGTDSFTFTSSDGGLTSNLATVSITISAANDDPTVVADAFNVDQDTTANTLNVLANDFDVDSGDTLTVTSVGIPSNGGSVSVSGFGSSVDYTPAAGYVGAETFTYTVEDSAGASVSAIVSMTVDAVVPTNVAPLAQAGVIYNQQACLLIDCNVTYDGSASTDADSVGSNNSDIVTYEWYESGNLIATGVTPTVLMSLGDYQITLVVTDTGGLTDSDTISVSVQPANLAMVEIEQSRIKWEDGRLMIHGKVSLPVGKSHFDVNSIGTTAVNILGVGAIASEAIDFTVKGSDSKHWKYKIAKGTPNAIDLFKLDWKGAKFHYHTNGWSVKTHHIGADSTTLAIHPPGNWSSAVSIDVGGITINVAADGTVSTIPSTLMIDVEDDENEFMVELPYQLSTGMTMVFSGGISESISVQDYYSAAVAKFKLHANFDTTSIDVSSLTPTLTMDLTLGDEGFSGNTAINPTDWTKLTSTKWKYDHDHGGDHH